MKIVLPLVLLTAVFGSSCLADQPNVVLIMCDDLGWGDLRCYNEKTQARTPCLDEMAKHSLKFERFYAAAPVCSPTRGSVLTGRHPFRYGITTANVGHMRKSEITLPEILKANGYATGHFGKWHLGTLTKTVRDSNRGGPKGAAHFAPPVEHGYDVCFVTEAKVPTYDPMLKPVNANRRAWDSILEKENAVAYGTRYWDENGKEVKEGLEGDDSKLTMDRAIGFIEQSVNKDQPFLAVIWFHAPHLPVVASERDRKPYKALDTYFRNYFGCVSAMDRQIGRLREKLRALTVADDTLVCFCSDNGPEGNAKAPGSTGGLRGRKRSLYEGGIRVPGLIEWPARIKGGSTTKFAAVTSDYMPTILDVLKIKMPDDREVDGVSLLPVIDGKQKLRSGYIGFQHGKQRAWIGQRYKIYRNSKKDWELYDLENDRSETKNIAKENRQLLNELKSSFEKWEQSCAADSQAGKSR